MKSYPDALPYCLVMDPDSDNQDVLDLAEHVVATSEDEDPRETLVDLFGHGRVDRDQGEDYLTEQFLENDVSIGLEDYFLENESRHEIRYDNRVEHVPCVADALIAAVLVDSEYVVVESIDPVSSGPVTFRVTEDDLDVSPPDHVVSIGMSEELPGSLDMISAVGCDELRDVDYDDRLSHCRYINAFESVENYREWADSVDAVTVAVPAEPLMRGIRWFASGPVFH